MPTNPILAGKGNPLTGESPEQRAFIGEAIAVIDASLYEPSTWDDNEAIFSNIGLAKNSETWQGTPSKSLMGKIADNYRQSYQVEVFEDKFTGVVLIVIKKKPSPPNNIAEMN